MTWVLSDRIENTEQIDQINCQVGFSSGHAFITKANDPQFFYRYNPITEIITETGIGTFTKHGVGPYRPDDGPILHNGLMYAVKRLDITIPTANRDILQVFEINPSDGSLTLVLDTWDGTNCDAIYRYGFCYSPITGKPVGWETDYKRSDLYSAQLISHGGAMYLGMILALEPVVSDGFFGLCPPWTSWRYVDNRFHNVFILASYDDANSWLQSSTVEATGDGIGFDPNSRISMYQHGSQCGAFVTRKDAADDAVYFLRENGWHHHQEDAMVLMLIENIQSAHQGAFWRLNAGDARILQYATTNFLAAGWTNYFTYDASPKSAQFPHAVDAADGCIIVDDAGIPQLSVYFNKTFDDFVTVVGNPDGNFYDYIGWATFRGAYVAVTYYDLDIMDHVLEIYYNDERNIGGLPIGLDLDPVEDSVYITGITPTSHVPFMVDILTANLVPGVPGSGVFASGIKFYAPGFGWLYPHAAAHDFVYLWGYASPEVKAFIYSGVPNAGATILGLPAQTYIGGLHSSPMYDPDDVNFCTVATGVSVSGNLAHSVDAGSSYNWIMPTPFPVMTLFRNIIYEGHVLGSGEADWIGASGGYGCPIRISMDLDLWENRCENLPSITITEIDAY